MSKPAETKTPHTTTTPAAHPEKKHSEAAPTTKTKGPAGVPGGCNSVGCKAQGSRFGFCEPHFDHFKFGLIKKTGEPVSDYEKKFEHYQAMKTRQGHNTLKKVA